MNKKQIAVIAGSVLVIVLLLFANTKLPEKESKQEMSDHTGTDHTGTGPLVDSAKNMEQLAIASNLEKNWNEAGNRYYKATRFAKEAEKPALYKKAMECFEKTLALNPKNVEAKINLGACYVEGSTEPMKGIGMLREIEKTDSNNVNLQLNFAFFSEKSGQWDKAIARFKKVLKIQPDFIEAYLHLADAYEQKGDKAKAVESLEKYSTLTDDVTVKTEIQNYINKLKN